MIGWSGFKLIRDVVNGHSNYYDLGYRFRREFWGRGYATESAKAMVAYGFEQMKLEKIYAIADVSNLDSQKVLQKCGLNQIETFSYDGIPHYWFELRNPALHLTL